MQNITSPQQTHIYETHTHLQNIAVATATAIDDSD